MALNCPLRLGKKLADGLHSIRGVMKACTDKGRSPTRQLAPCSDLVQLLLDARRATLTASESYMPRRRRDDQSVEGWVLRRDVKDAFERLGKAPLLCRSPELDATAVRQLTGVTLLCNWILCLLIGPRRALHRVHSSKAALHFFAATMEQKPLDCQPLGLQPCTANSK